MKRTRVLVLVHKHLVPPEGATADTAAGTDWKMEWDVISTLRERGHALRVVGLHDDLAPLRREIDEFRPAIVFNLMEAFDDVGVFDQNIVSFLELLRVPYTGCNPRGLTLARDKALARKVMAYEGIRVPDFLVVPRGQRTTVPRRLGYPLIVKSLHYESSIGIAQASVVASDGQLHKRVQFIHDTLGTAAMVEQFVDGREFYVAVLGNSRARAFPVWEMSFGKLPETSWRIATERAKWNVPYQKRHGIEFAAAALPDGVAARVQHVARSVYRALDLTGYARIDLRMARDGRVFVLEANPNPQLMRGGYVAESAKLAGMSYELLLERIIALGLLWRPERTG